MTDIEDGGHQPGNPVAVGLVGAGPWAAKMHAPTFTGGPETRLAGVWARRPEAAAELAGRYGVPAFTEYGALLDACEAVAFAVPPDVQARLAAEAARAGKALLLDKPIGLTLAEAAGLTEAVDAAGVVSQLTLSIRYLPRVREFLAAARGFTVSGARGCQLSGSFLPGSRYATPWRLAHGALHDLGPHVLDLLDAAVGPIVDLTATGAPRGWLALTCRHESGAVSQVALSGDLPDTRYACYELFGPAGSLTLDFRAVDRADSTDGTAGWANLRAEFAAAVRSGRSHELDVHRGLYLQRLIDRALASLAG